MSAEHISADVSRFIETYLGSVAQLEILLALHAECTRHFSADELGQLFYIEPEFAASRLNDLKRSGLIESDATGKLFRFAASSELKRIVAELSALYAQRRTTIISLLYAKPHRDIQAFSDAFRLRQKPDADGKKQEGS
jgi:hypothetical protein